jgi:hypothetical protein
MYSIQEAPNCALSTSDDIYATCEEPIIVEALPYYLETSTSIASPEGYTGATSCSYMSSELNTMWWKVGPFDDSLCLTARAKLSNGESVTVVAYSGNDCGSLQCLGQMNSSPYSKVPWSITAGVTYYVATALQFGSSSSSVTMEIEVSSHYMLFIRGQHIVCR